MDARRRSRTPAVFGLRVEPSRGPWRLVRGGWSGLRGAQMEAARVVWPTRRQALWLSAAVCAVAASAGLVLGGIDVTVAELFRELLGRR